MLRDHEGSTSIVFTESVGIRDSNEAEILSIRKALVTWKSFGEGKLITEGNSANAIKWAMGHKRPPWRLITVVRKIREMVSGMDVSFLQIGRATNGMADFFAKLVVTGLSSGVFFL